MAKSINVPFSFINVTASSFINEPCSRSPPAPLDRNGNAPPPSCAAGAIHPPARSFPRECCAMREKRFRLYAARAFYIGRRSLLLLRVFLSSKPIDGQAQKEERTAYLPDTKMMSTRRQRTEVRLEDRARERQIAEAVVVDQALDGSGRGGWIARELGHARVVASNRRVEVAVDTTGRRL